MMLHNIAELLSKCISFVGVRWWTVSERERMILGSWILVGMVITLSYSCNLTSLLAVRRIPHPVQTLRDLLDNPSLTVIMSPNSIITATIAVSSLFPFFVTRGYSAGVQDRMYYSPFRVSVHLCS